MLLLAPDKVITSNSFDLIHKEKSVLYLEGIEREKPLVGARMTLDAVITGEIGVRNTPETTLLSPGILLNPCRATFPLPDAKRSLAEPRRN